MKGALEARMLCVQAAGKVPRARRSARNAQNAQSPTKTSLRKLSKVIHSRSLDPQCAERSVVDFICLSGGLAGRASLTAGPSHWQKGRAGQPAHGADAA